MKYRSRAYVYIVFYADRFDISEFSDLIDIQPTHYTIKGEKGEYISAYKETTWKFQMNETNALEEMRGSLEDLVHIFKDKIILINKYVQENNIGSKCFIVIKAKGKEDVGASLSNEFIAFLNKLNMQIEIDVYKE